MVNIKILGTGCSRCKVLTSRVQEVVSEYHINATVEKVEDLTEIMSYNIMATPALVIDGVLRTKGQILSKAEILEAIKNYAKAPEMQH